MTRYNTYSRSSGVMCACIAHPVNTWSQVPLLTTTQRGHQNHSWHACMYTYVYIQLVKGTASRSRPLSHCTPVTCHCRTSHTLILLFPCMHVSRDTLPTHNIHTAEWSDTHTIVLVAAAGVCSHCRTQTDPTRNTTHRWSSGNPSLQRVPNLQ